MIRSESTTSSLGGRRGGFAHYKSCEVAVTQGWSIFQGHTLDHSEHSIDRYLILQWAWHLS